MVTIVADTTCSLPQDEIRGLGVPLLPQIIIFDEQQYRDDFEIDTPTFLTKLKAATSLPKTAAPAPSLYTPIYKEHLDKGDTIIVICPSAELSGTFRSATVAAEDFPGGDIRIIDTRTVASGLGSIVMEAFKMAKAGADASAIVDRINDLSARMRV